MPGRPTVLPQCEVSDVVAGDGGRLRLTGSLRPEVLRSGLRLRCVCPDSELQVEVVFAADGGFTAELTLPVPVRAPQVWAVRSVTHESGEEVATVRFCGPPPRAVVVEAPDRTYRLRPYVEDGGGLHVELRPLGRHAEVERVDVEPDALVVSGTTLARRLGGNDAVDEPACLVAVSRLDSGVVRSAADVTDGVFTARLELARLLEERTDPQVWDLFLELTGSGRRYRMGSHLDDVADKRRVLVYPPQLLVAAGLEHQVRAYYTAENNLSVRCRPLVPTPAPTPDAPATPAAAPATSPRPLRRPLPKPVLIRLLRALARSGPRRRSPPPQTGDRLPVFFLIMHAYGMGGTIRTVTNLAGGLARHRDVEILSVKRRREQPYFPLPPGVPVRSLDDAFRLPRGLLGWLRRLLMGVPSVLVHQEDYAFEASSLWTDLQIARCLRGLPPGVLVTTRPALNLLAATLAPHRLLTVGQEHMNYHAHRPGLAAELHRHYGRLDALAVLTRDDEQDYRALLADRPVQVVRIPNALPPLAGGTSDSSAKLVVAAGRLTWQKGFDLLVAAFAEVVRQHPDWVLRIYGDGRREGQLRRLVQRHGLHSSVLLMGSTQRLGEELEKASVFALSSRYEGFGMVILEALSKGLPVVSFDCPRGPGEILTHGRDGLLVPNGDVAAFAVALGELCGDADRRRAMAREGLGTAARYALPEIAAQWDAVLRELPARRRSRQDEVSDGVRRPRRR